MFMMVSSRWREPLIMVVLCICCPPPMVCLKVILKSPVIGFSLSPVFCANEIPVMAVTANKIIENKNNLDFMMKLRGAYELFGGCMQLNKNPRLTQDSDFECGRDVSGSPLFV